MHLSSVTIHSDRFPECDLFPFSIPALRHSREVHLRRPVVLLVGENGSGKSTLLDAIARSCGIAVWDKPRRHESHANPFEDSLARYLSVSWVNGRVPGSLFRAETFRDLSDFLDDVALCDPGRLAYHGGHLLNTLSHGQGFLAYFQGRFQPNGLYLLDEPEAALSPASQVRLAQILGQLAETGSRQFIIATHSPFLMAYPEAQILSFDGLYIQEVRCEQTLHYRLYEQFFTQRATQPSAAGRRPAAAAVQPACQPATFGH